MNHRTKLIIFWMPSHIVFRSRYWALWALVLFFPGVDAEVGFQMLCFSWMSPRTLYSDVASLHCGLDDWIVEYSHHFCFGFLRNVFWCDLWDRVLVKTHNRIVCNCVASVHCEWACAISDYQLSQRTLRILYICVLSPQCGWSCASSRSLALDTIFAVG